VHKGVHSLAKNADTALYGDVTISEGTGIAITRSSNDLQIASTVTGGAGQVTGIDRWTSSGGATYELSDISEYLLEAYDNGTQVDPLTYSLSSDRTQLVFDSAITAGHVVTAEYIVAQV
jgi:hypothetical protein